MTSPLKIAVSNETIQPNAARGAIFAFVQDAESETVVRHALGDRVETPEAIRRGDIRTAMEALRHQRSPNVLIVDVSGVALPVTEVNRLAEVCEPGVHVIVVGDRNDIGLYRDL